MSMLGWILWAVIMLGGNMIAASFTVSSVIWFNIIWVVVCILGNTIPYFINRNKKRENL
jgi:hypothetical protein